MTSTRLFRILVCALVICSLLISWSPIRAKAVVAEAVAVTGAGVFGVLFSIAMGCVFMELTGKLINDIGRSMEDYLYQTTTEEETEILDVWIEPLHVDLGGGSSQDPDDDNEKIPFGGLFAIPEDLLDNLIGWASTLINGEGVEVEDPDLVAPEGYAYYNDLLLKLIPQDVDLSVYPYVSIYHGNYYGKTTVVFSSSLPYVDLRINDNFVQFRCESARAYVVSSSYDTGWQPKREVESFAEAVSEFYWTNYDLYGTQKFNYGQLILKGTEPVYVGTEIVKPDIYVGDIPQQVQDGTFKEEEYVLPYINYNQIFQGQTDTVAALNNVATQLQNQTITYDQYMDQIKTEVDTNTGTDSGTSSDTWQPPSNPGQFALDLTKYFPFCIPFDLYDLFTCLNADPVAPVIHWELPMPGGSTYPIELDLSPFNSVAQLLRRMQLLLFCVGLAIKTRDLIKG